MDLSTKFSNPRREVKALVRRVLRGGSARKQHSREPQIADSRGPNVRELRSPQTLLNREQVASLVAEYESGVAVQELAAKYGVHRGTVSAHARRQGIPPRRRSLSEAERETVMRLYEDGLTMSEIADQFSVSTGAVRTALVLEGVTIQSGGQRWATTVS